MLVGFILVLAVASPVLAATGVDVASYQHPGGAAVNWNQVRSAGYTFAYVKATESTTYINPYFASDFAGIGAAGLYRGAYHYARPALPLSTAQAQARYFVSQAGSQGGSKDLPPMLDLEETGGLAPSDLVAWTLTWLHEVESLTGRTPVLYTGYYFWRDQLGSTTSLSGYRLWLPQYTSKPAPSLVPAAWPSWTFWQYSSTGQVPGIVGNVDVNRFCCADSSLAALAGGQPGQAFGNPFGSLDGALLEPGALRVDGWAIDPDTTGPITVHVYVDGALRAAVKAKTTRSDVGASFPGFGSAHGFDTSLSVGPGSHRVCVYAINSGAGTSNPLLGCRTVVPNPVGSVDAAGSSSTGGLVISGWAADPDTTAPIDVHLYLDGAFRAATSASLYRPDVAAAFPEAGSDHGWQFDVESLPGGTHTACVYAINYGPGTTNPLLGCRTVTVLDGTPVGNIDAVSTGLGSLRVRGWALDPDTTDPVTAQVLVDGTLRGSGLADGSRPDVGAAFPAAGDAHGYDLTVDGLGGGRHQVCVRVPNIAGAGGDPVVACRTVDLPADPLGNLEVVEAGAGLRVAGWALDPDTAGPIAVHVYVDGHWAGLAQADGSRPDVGAAFAAYGADHGFDTELPLPADGAHHVCVYGIDVGPGNNALLGCGDLDVRANPFGTIDKSSRSAGQAHLSGWVIDPDTTDPIAVHVYVDGAWAGAFEAGGVRTDVGAAYPAYGADHGFDLSVPVGPNPVSVCVYAINAGPGTANTALGCRQI